MGTAFLHSFFFLIHSERAPTSPKPTSKALVLGRRLVGYQGIQICQDGQAKRTKKPFFSSFQTRN
ncbi:hypothetical protein BHM03_00057297 [Ensete ventricosum]|nr:hypothetical protein BHM03_00057297 [Ensete ventricosum]